MKELENFIKKTAKELFGSHTQQAEVIAPKDTEEYFLRMRDEQDPDKRIKIMQAWEATQKKK
ncbi:MAG: hypothetical protein GX885_11460 [Methanomicrobiales archaeon]|nr:hypothetical protein [Methanomicrobiales archaeon]